MLRSPETALSADERDASGAVGTVLVVGGGPAGLAAAIELRMRTGLRVVVVERRGEPAEGYGETVTPGTVLALERLGLGEAFRADGHLACPGGMSSWGRARPGHSDRVLDPLGPAWHLDRRRFEAMLRARAVELAVVLRPQTRALTVRADRGSVTVQLRDAAGPALEVAPAWLVDATGHSARLARQLGARRQRQDRLVAVLRFAELVGGSFPAQTVVEAAEDGWWYAARLPRSRLVIAHVTDPERAGGLVRDGGRCWQRALAATTMLAAMLAACARRDHALRSRPVTVARLDRVTGPHWFAIGDAAAEHDPITGSGIQDALADAHDVAVSIAAEVGCLRRPGWTYADRFEARFAEHLARRAALYDSEQRWADSPFWVRRHRSANG